MHVEVSSEGFLVNPDDWSEEVAYELARNEGFPLTEEHMKYVREARFMYQRDNVVPPLRRFCKELGVSKQELYDLFVMGPMKLICKFGGLPKPTGCT